MALAEVKDSLALKEEVRDSQNEIRVIPLILCPPNTPYYYTKSRKEARNASQLSCTTWYLSLLLMLTCDGMVLKRQLAIMQV